MRKRTKVIITVLIILATVIIFYIASKYSFRVVASGSMEPTIRIGSLNIIKKCSISDTQNNDIICFVDANDKSVDTIHRVINIYKTDNKEIVLQTKGDNNNNIDNTEVTSDMLIGKVICTLNNISDFIIRVRNIDVFAIIITIAIIILCIKSTIKDKEQ